MRCCVSVSTGCHQVPAPAEQTNLYSSNFITFTIRQFQIPNITLSLNMCHSFVLYVTMLLIHTYIYIWHRLHQSLYRNTKH